MAINSKNLTYLFVSDGVMKVYKIIQVRALCLFMSYKNCFAMNTGSTDVFPC